MAEEVEPEPTPPAKGGKSSISKGPNARRNQLIAGGTLALVVLTYLMYRQGKTAAATAPATSTPLTGGVDMPSAGGGGGGGGSGGLPVTLPPVLTSPIAVLTGTPTKAVTAAKKPVTGASYAVRSGDTLTAIAKRFGVSLGALESANAGTIKADAQKHGKPTDFNHWIYSGEHLIIPGKGTAPAPALKTAAPATHAAGPAAVAHPTGSQFLTSNKRSGVNVGTVTLPTLAHQ